MTDALPEPRPPQPLPADLLRVGDAERQQAVAALGEHFAAGRLDQDEFDTRVQAAYASRTRVDLHGLFGDLPEPVPFRAAAAGPPRGWDAGREARESRPRRHVPPVVPVLVAIAIFVGVSLLVHFPVIPLLFLLLWFGGGRRRSWAGGRPGPGPGGRPYR
jgi:Domain of unknown function (DUF1707)